MNMTMRKRQLALHAVLACVVASVAGPLRAQHDGIDWLDNYQQALRQARQSGKPIFLEFRCEP